MWALLAVTLICFSCFYGVTATKSIYITFHGGGSDANSASLSSKMINNVYQYSIEGTFIGPVISDDSDLRELRGMVQVGQNLLVCNAYKHDSRVLVTPLCGGSASTFLSSNVSHPYGISVGGRNRGSLAVSNQDTGEISIFSAHTGKPIGNGVFAKVDDPRGLAFDGAGNLWVASKGASAVLVFDTNGNQIYSHSMKNPIGVASSTDGKVIFAGTNSDPPTVYSFNTTSQEVINSYQTPHGGMDHPAGIVEDEGVLYVLGQDKLELLTFQVETAQYIGKLITDLPDTPEQILIVDC